MRLYFDADSESLFWDEFNSDPFTTDVTDDPRFRKAAKERGLVDPEVISEVLDAKANSPRGQSIADATVCMRERTDDMEAETTSGIHTVASAIIGAQKKWSRKPADFYPTPVDVTESLIEWVKSVVPDGGRIWEPACGDGRLARVLEWHGFEVIATDLREYPGYGYGGLDFLNEHPLTKWGWDIGEIDAIVTNPPFNLAEEFISQALKLTPNVALLLKSQYWHAARRVPLFQRHRPSHIYPLTWRPSFLEKERGNSPLMDVMWVCWSGKADVTHYQPIEKRRYEGYAGRGLKPALQILEGELDELSAVLRKLVPEGDQ